MGKESLGMTDEEKVGKQLYINPDVCIDCGACVPECPVDAIHPTEVWAIKEGELEYVNKNYEFYGQTYKPKTK
jgi:ferredoxin